MYSQERFLTIYKHGFYIVRNGSGQERFGTVPDYIKKII